MVKAVALVIYHPKTDEVLVGKKIFKSGSLLDGKYCLPGEKLEEGETDEDAIKRCGISEAGIDLHLKTMFGEIENSDGNRVSWYECTTDNYELVPGEDLEDTIWVKRREVPNYCDDAAIEMWPEKVRKYFT